MKLAVFDCDGTLIDGQASICDAMERAFAGHGLELPDRNQVRRAVGLSLPVAVSILLPDTDSVLHEALVEDYKQHFRASRSSGELQQPLFPGIRALLDDLRDTGWQLAVATGMSRRGLDHCLATHRLTSHFGSLQTADDHPSKPHPDMLEAALLGAGAEARDAVMIGDTMYDMQMADLAGVRGIGVAWGYHTPEELLTVGASAVADDPAHLRELLR